MSDKNISHAISGGLSGLVSMTVTYPLVTLSTNAQTNTQMEENLDKSEAFEENLEETKNLGLKKKIVLLLKRLLNRIRFVIANSKKFYAGLESALIGIVSVNFFYYYVYNLVGNYLRRIKKEKPNSSLSIQDSLLTGLTAGVVSRIVTNPIWVANTRMTVRKKVSEKEKTDAKNAITKDDNTFKVMMKIFQNEGLGGLFSGLGPALILVSSPVIQFTIFEQLKNLLLNVNRKNGVSKNKITPLEALFLGSLGKLVATLATYPYYTIRSRMHLNKSNDASSFKFLTGMVQNEGIRSLYRGLDAKLLQSILSSGLIFYFKEELMLLVETFLGLANTNAGNLVNVVSKITKRK